MHMCLIASSVKVITKCIAVMYFSQDFLMLRLICMFLGCVYANTAGAIKLYNDRLIDWKIISPIPIHVTNYEICNILCLKNRHTRLF